MNKSDAFVTYESIQVSKSKRPGPRTKVNETKESRSKNEIKIEKRERKSKAGSRGRKNEFNEGKGRNEKSGKRRANAEE